MPGCQGSWPRPCAPPSSTTTTTTGLTLRRHSGSRRRQACSSFSRAKPRYGTRRRSNCCQQTQEGGPQPRQSSSWSDATTVFVSEGKCDRVETSEGGLVVMGVGSENVSFEQLRRCQVGKHGGLMHLYVNLRGRFFASPRAIKPTRSTSLTSQRKRQDSSSHV